ncbi:hypothetical protein J6590_090453 [Homalodisca vitripennis]|nr:hypothetical protein J6590_090453 [Homalodisca vitripennis]
MQLQFTFLLVQPLDMTFTYQRLLFRRCTKKKRVQRLSTDIRIKQRGAWLLLGWVTAERSCPCKQSACPVIGGGSEVTFKPLEPRLSVREGFLALNSPSKIRHLYFTFNLKS